MVSQLTGRHIWTALRAAAPSHPHLAHGRKRLTSQATQSKGKTRFLCPLQGLSARPISLHSRTSSAIKYMSGRMDIYCSRRDFFAPTAGGASFLTVLIRANQHQRQTQDKPQTKHRHTVDIPWTHHWQTSRKTRAKKMQQKVRCESGVLGSAERGNTQQSEIIHIRSSDRNLLSSSLATERNRRQTVDNP